MGPSKQTAGRSKQFLSLSTVYGRRTSGLLDSYPEPLYALRGEVYSIDGTLLLHHFVERSVSSYGQMKALTFHNRTINVETLNATANRLARSMLHYVRIVGEQANRDGDFLVAVCMEPSDRLVLTLLAVWKIGAAYLPLDPNFPSARVRHILNEAQPMFAVVDKDDPELFGSFRNIAQYEELHQQAADLSPERVPYTETITGRSTSLAIVLYTSGSTGIPKGVRLSHKGVLNRLCWQWREFPYGPEERLFVFKTAVTFVDSVGELWGPLLQTRHVLVVPRDVAKDPEQLLHVLEDYTVRRVFLVPSLLRSLLLVLEYKDKRILSHIKTWVCSREPLPVQLAHDFFDYFDYFNSGDRVLCNYYGSTEVMGVGTCHVMRSAVEVKECAKVPIGRPLFNTAIYLLDEKRHPVVSGEKGELYVSGLNLAEGYVRGRHPDRFLPNRLSFDPDFTRLYRTGDFGCVVKGLLMYEGRTDSQVKVRGHRVDLSEVEHAVAAVPGVDKSVVLCYRPGEIEQALLAYVTTYPGACLMSQQVETELHNSLATYMQPQVFVVDNIPLLVNGKTDRQALLRRYEEQNTGNEGHRADSLELDYTGIAAKQLEAAHALFETVALVLGGSMRSKVCREANFYELGGNSLNSVFTVTKLRQQGYVIGITNFISSKDLQQVLDQMRRVKDDDTAAVTEK